MIRHFALAALLLYITSPAGAATEPNVYTFGVVPQTGATRIAKDWTPILAYLENKTGLTLRFATTRNIPTFAKRLEAGKYDFGYVNPTDYVKFAGADSYVPMARARNVRLKGVIVVRKDSPVEKIEQLQDKTLAVPANAFAADVVPRAVLRNMGIDVTAHAVAGHDSVYRAVALGRFNAGGGVMRTFNSTAPEFRDQLRVLWTSDAYTPHAFVAHARVPAEVVRTVQEALIDMAEDPAGRTLLRTVAPEGIDQARDEDWNDVRDLDI